MKFSFEVPVEYLDYFTEYQDYIFVLSFMLENKDYFNYVKKMYNSGKEIIIDNSSNELNQPACIEDLLICHNMFPKASIISPDWLDWGLMKQISQAKILSKYMSKEKIITPINNINWIEYYYNEGFSNIAMGYNLRYLKPWDLEDLFNCHFLGLNSIRELFIAEPSSCDTGLPIKLAKQGINIKTWVSLGCPHDQLETDFFSLILDQQELTLAKENMQTLKTIGGLINV